MSLVSVIIPVYNRERQIASAIRSACAQTHENLEIIVVDDKSTDATQAAAREFNDSRVKIITHDKNLGPAEARNTGIGAAGGRYVAFHDSDDEWSNKKIAVQLNALKAAPPSTKAVTCDHMFAHRNGWIEVKQAIPEDIQILRIGAQAVNVGSCLLVNREAINKVGPFNRRMRFNEDIEWLFRFIQAWPNGIIKAEGILATRTASPIYPAHARLDAAQILSEQAPNIRKAFGLVGYCQFMARQHLDLAYARYLSRHNLRAMWHVGASLIYSPKPASHFVRRAVRHHDHNHENLPAVTHSVSKKEFG